MLREHMLFFAEHREEREAMAHALYEKTRTHFSLSVMIQKQRDIYAKILRRKARKAERDGVLICGAYGKGNRGDNTILSAIVGQLTHIDPELPITVLSRDPRETRTCAAVPAIYTFNPCKSHRLMKKSRLYISGGGTLMQDATSTRSLLYYLYSIRQASHYLRLFAPLVPILYLDCIVDGIHKGLGQQIYCVRVNTLTNLLDVIFLFLLLPRYGIGGYYFTYVLTHVINFYLSIRRLLQITHAAPYRKFLVLSVSCVFLSVGISAAFLPKVPRWSSVCFGAGIYLTLLSLLLIMTGCIDKSQSSP